MIRIVIALFVLSVVLCAFIVLRPFSDSDKTANQGNGSEVEVTRAATEQSLLTEVVAMSGNASVQASAAPATSARAEVIRPSTDGTSLEAMTNNVLAQLGFEGVEPVVTPIEEQRQSTASILAGIQAATGLQAEVGHRETLENLVVNALRDGQSDSDIDLLVNTAATNGQVTVPEVLVTSDGRVDTHVLLSNIITQAQRAAGAPRPAFPTISPENSEGVEIRIVQRANQEVQARFYTVQSGDSLGAIAIKFFGSVEYFPQIFEANRQTLSSPDRIRVGQRLVIPQIDT